MDTSNLLYYKELLSKKPKKMSELRNDWNDYTQWLKGQQVPELDNNGKPLIDLSTGKNKMKSVHGDPILNTSLGMQLFKKYIKEHPNTTLSEEYIPIIREELVFNRDRGIKSLQEGRSKLTKTFWSPGNNGEKDFMKGLIENEASDNPNYPGQYLTQYFFPGGHHEHYNNNKLEKSQDFSTNETHPDFSLDDYNKASDKRAFLENAYKNFNNPAGNDAPLGTTGQQEMSHYIDWKNTKERAQEMIKQKSMQPENKLSEFKNKKNAL